jgi:hypothetical protein
MTYEPTKAPRSERLEFFKFQYSCQIFAQARKILVYIQDKKILSGHPLHYTLWTSFMVAYGKPFKQRAPLRLDPVLVPEEFWEEHQTLLSFRDKMFAHTDLDLVAEHSLDSLNSIVAMVEDGNVKMGTGFIYPNEEATARYRSLVEKLIQKTNYHAAKRWESWDVVVRQDGWYMINVGETSDDILLPIKWEAGSILGAEAP